MPSLLELLFDTMPLAGARKAALEAWEKDSTAFRSMPIHFLRDYAEAIRGSELAKLNIPNKPLTDKQKSSDHHDRPAWGFDASRNFHSVSELTCRSPEEDYRASLVLNSLEFGIETDKGFENCVEIDVPLRGKRRLPLTGDALLTTFLVQNGLAMTGDKGWWPIDAWHDFGFVHVFLYDVSLLTGDITTASQLSDTELNNFKKNVDRLRQGAPRDSLSEVRTLFTDEAWQPLPEPEAVVAQVLRDAAEAAHAALTGQAHKQLSIAPHRVLVCVSTTAHRAHDDFQPGGIGWAARLYPVVMVNSTHPLLSVRGGLRCTRPATTTIDGVASAQCNCKEMNAEINVLLVADANSGNGATNLPDGLPWALWNNLFAYYIPDATSAVGGAKIKVVDRDRTSARTINNVVERVSGSNDITRLPRQGAFDNVHFSPTMRMPAVQYVNTSRLRATQEPRAVSPDRTRMRFDDIVMAPVCAHDCFHMHWRWSDAVPAGDLSVHGWSSTRPYARPGRPMVPHNQNVHIRLPSKTQLIYEADAEACDAGDWQIICHHGAAYMMATGTIARGARTQQDAVSPEKDYYVPVLWSPAPIAPILAVANWPVFYWRNRFYLKEDEDGDVVDFTPVERTKILDLHGILHEGAKKPGHG